MTLPSAKSGEPAAIDAEELAALRAIVEGTAQTTGEDFFRSLVRNLSLATGVPNAFVAEFAGTSTRVRTLAYWAENQFLSQREWDLPDTPCEHVLNGEFCHFPTGVSQRFPKEEGVESYLGVPLRDAQGQVLGHLAVFDAKLMPAEPKLLCGSAFLPPARPRNWIDSAQNSD